jgi:hypothetical protein
MRIIINDSSALIDLAKTRLLEHLPRLPYRNNSRSIAS